MSSFDLTNKIAFVSGASRGLGEQFARTLATAGADLIITSRTLDSLENVASDLRALGRDMGEAGPCDQVDGALTV